MFEELLGENTAAAALCLTRFAVVLVAGTHLLPLLTPIVPSGWSSVVASIQLGPGVRRSTPAFGSVLEPRNRLSTPVRILYQTFPSATLLAVLDRAGATGLALMVRARAGNYITIVGIVRLCPVLVVNTWIRGFDMSWDGEQARAS